MHESIKQEEVNVHIHTHQAEIQDRKQPLSRGTPDMWGRLGPINDVKSLDATIKGAGNSEVIVLFLPSRSLCVEKSQSPVHQSLTLTQPNKKHLTEHQ